ncbi:MAG TPA: DEAD/DEAH box helicase [Steroidobacteraceae bacterium]
MTPNALSAFHPAVAGWFRSRFPEPTEAQARAWAVTSQHRNALIAAPTGSGKTLAAFLSAINDLVVEGLSKGLSDEVHVLYISPLKALSNDIQKNLQEPLAGIRDQLLELGIDDVPIRDAVRTGDTSAFERTRMRKSPPHILVTTPESLFILLTSESGRAMLKSTKSVIVDELHSVAGSKRGSHLMLSLERLDALCGKPPVRVGLSATVKPLEAMARFLVGAREVDVEIVDTGHVRERDLALELPRSPLEAIMSNEVWDELYNRLAELILAHRTTLIFVNNRRLAERATRFLAERLGAEHVACHHGSLSKEHRLSAETRLKAGSLKALIATSSLELGIDIGDIDLVCQMGSPRLISALLQRVGRAGHAIGTIPKGRLFPLSLDDLVECTALLDSVRRGELDRIRVPQKPLDVLSQQIVAEVACREWGVDELLTAFRRAQPYADLTAEEFEQVLQMLAEGYSTRRGRRSAYLHYDTVNRRLRPRKGARLTAVTNAGVIPDQFDYDVVLNPEGLRIGSIGEDFAFESMPGDIFQLGNTSYRVQKVEVNKVYVEDARGMAPTLPFWMGEAPARSDELSAAVSRLREDALGQLADGGAEELEKWLHDERQLDAVSASQLAQYLAAGQAALGTLPTLRTIVFERFFDDVGDTHVVVHSTYGSRINRAWGLALRKRFCRQFNFELQASALEDSIVLSLGPTHSFPLEDCQNFLKSATAGDVLVQALLDAPVFGTRWRWDAAIALALVRNRHGKRMPAPFQRADSEDLLAVVFPDQLACAENLTGPREIPDHPLVKQAIDDCLREFMDVDGFLALLKRIEDGAVQVHCLNLSAPSPLSHAVLGARPYAFLDDGDAEGRRTRSITTDRLLDPKDAADLGRLDPAAIAKVKAEAWPEIGSHDELHDALVVYGFLTAPEIEPWKAQLAKLRDERRVMYHDGLWLAVERSAEFERAKDGDTEALAEILRSRLELVGPLTETSLRVSVDVPEGPVRAALLMLESQGSIMRGRFSGGREEEWCERRLLIRIHRLTRDRKRNEIQAVPPAQFMRFLFRWQRVAMEGRDDRQEGEAGLLAVLQQLEGFAIPAGAWERDILPLRVKNYTPSDLDKLCSAGRIAWVRPVEASGSEIAPAAGPVRSTPIMLVGREALAHWQRKGEAPEVVEGLSARGQKILESLQQHGASFFDDLVHDTGLLRSDVETGLGELVSRGRVTSDSFAGIRALITSKKRRERLRQYRRPFLSLEDAGRWSLPRRVRVESEADALGAPEVDHIARVLLRRYGVVFRKLLERESGLPPWRDLFYVYRRMEARGEIRGGRFVSGFAGEQFALPEASDLLKGVSRDESGDQVSVSATDPLNLAGIVSGGELLPAISRNRVLFDQGVPIALQAGGEVRFLREVPNHSQWQVRNLLIRRPGMPAPVPTSETAH